MDSVLWSCCSTMDVVFCWDGRQAVVVVVVVVVVLSVFSLSNKGGITAL